MSLSVPVCLALIALVLASPIDARSVSVQAAGRGLAQTGTANAEFAAVWCDASIDAGCVRTASECSDPADTFCTSLANSPLGPNGEFQTALMGKIKVAQSKDLFISLSSEIALITSTTAKATKGTTSTSTASASLQAGIYLQQLDNSGNPVGSPIAANPNTVTLSARTQSLSVTFDGSGFEADDYITVGLALSTTQASSFNFIAPDLTSAVYKVYAVFTPGVSASTNTAGSFAGARVTLGSRLLAAQEVRAVKDSLVSELEL